MDNVILEMKDIHKSFPGVYALNGVNLDLIQGEVHALLGENGAGKSTLIKVLAGIHSVDKGEVFINGAKCRIDNVQDSQKHGISVIHQELCLVPNMTVTENIFLGREIYKAGFLDKRSMHIKAQNLFDSLQLNIKVDVKVSSLSVAQQQMVEIAKALLVDSAIIVMDEPTSSLTEKEVEMLFKTIRELKAKNISVIYISHKLEELFQITDRVTVLRDGKYIGTKITKNTTKDELISMMVGRELTEYYTKSKHDFGDVILKVENLSKANVLDNISFNLRKGEILGISGLVGAGRTELARAIFGIDRFDSGTVTLEGKVMKIKSPKEAMDSGIALVPENRKEQGMFSIKSVSYNITLLVLDKFIKMAKVHNNLEEQITDEYVQKLSIKTPSNEQPVGNLSGGNQQKTVIAKWLATMPKVLILDEPTRGVDVGAKAEIYSIMSMLAEQGVGIIMISSELPEIINMSDRVLVMNKGRITGILEREELSQERIMQYATGGIKDEH
ncbi:MAG: sugar ABC transporter ATP-binding protein [Clostridiaceae bacterium]|nr:sugar ABC transporter ATP-binding protein [Clostridiaceae bacterium]